MFESFFLIPMNNGVTWETVAGEHDVSRSRFCIVDSLAPREDRVARG